MMNPNNKTDQTQPVLENKIAKSGLKVIKLDLLAPKEEMFDFDISPYLFKGLLLKEKEFRAAMKSFEWATVKDKVVCVYCSTDALIPKWAYMLITQHAFEEAADVRFGTSEMVYKQLFKEHLDKADWSIYENQRVILKGCSDGVDIPEMVYLFGTKKLMPLAKSIMYGEPCSTVPVYKRKK